MTLAEEIVSALMSDVDGTMSTRLVRMKGIIGHEADVGGWSYQCAVREVQSIIDERLKGAKE
jgi:hypothetical protein